MGWLACSLYPEILTKCVLYNETPLYLNFGSAARATGNFHNMIWENAMKYYTVEPPNKGQVGT